MVLKEGQLKILESFNDDEWADWINRVISRRHHTPTNESGNVEIHIILGDVFASLRTVGTREHFANGLHRVFESVPLVETSAEQFYYVFQLIPIVRPLDSRPLLRQYVFDYRSFFTTMNFGAQNLYAMLLVTTSKFGVDDELAEHVKHVAKTEDNLRMYLLAIRILGGDGRGALRVIGNVIPKLESPLDARQLARQLGGLVRRHGYRPLYEWYSENARWLTKKYPEEMERFCAVLGESLLPWTPEEYNDEFAVLLAAEIHALYQDVTAADLLFLAGLSPQTMGPLVVGTLSAVWTKMATRVERAEPWNIVDRDQHLKMLKDESPERALCVGDDCQTIDGERAALLEEVRKRASALEEAR